VAAGGASSRFREKAERGGRHRARQAEVKEKLAAIGLIPVGSTPEGLTKELAANTAFWQPIVKATGYKITN
jgi:tripartite-type tricarboxylate transporter receptor subunit TctC